ncbi:hypothetical protein evm_012862 [Chilo suppressalis]|nr:hypothetical protein evm_012862 [Chilo suppressalis]
MLTTVYAKPTRFPDIPSQAPSLLDFLLTTHPQGYQVMRWHYDLEDWDEMRDYFASVPCKQHCFIDRDLSASAIAILEEIVMGIYTITNGTFFYEKHSATAIKLHCFLQKAVSPHCRDCKKYIEPALTPFQLAWAQDAGQKRWRYYPDLTASLTADEIKTSMDNVGRPFQNEACNWYYKNYPSQKYDVILRKFSQ